MAASFRTHGSGAGVGGSSPSITIPASCQEGDVVALAVITTTVVGLTTPSGWTLRGQENPSAGATWLLTTTLDAGGPGSNVPLALSASSRTAAVLTAFSGATESGLQVASVIEASSVTPALPVLPSVPAGAGVAGFFLRRRAGSPAPDITTLPGTWLQGADNRSASTFGTSPEDSAETVYKLAGAAGSFGGESAVANQSSIGVQWLVAFPSAGGGPVDLDLVRLGGGLVDLRYGATAVDRAYLGSTQVWP